MRLGIFVYLYLRFIHTWIYYEFCSFSKNNLPCSPTTRHTALCALTNTCQLSWHRHKAKTHKYKYPTITTEVLIYIYITFVFAYCLHASLKILLGCIIFHNEQNNGVPIFMTFIFNFGCLLTMIKITLMQLNFRIFCCCFRCVSQWKNILKRCVVTYLTECVKLCPTQRSACYIHLQHSHSAKYYTFYPLPMIFTPLLVLRH